MGPSVGERGVPGSADPALAFVASAGSFVLAALVIAAAKPHVSVLIVGVPYIFVVIAVARLWGIAYAVPVAMASLLAFDWFYLPPTHPIAVPNTADSVELVVFLAVAVLFGQLAARAGRRAQVSEVARSALAEEQAALRRVATLVAGGAAPTEVLAAVAEEIGRLLDVDIATIDRYEPDGTSTVVAAWSIRATPWPVGSSWPLDGESVSGRVFRTRLPARIDEYARATGTIAEAARELGIQSAVGAPIVVDEELWGGAFAVSTQPGPQPAGTEVRIANFTELVATAISNTEARAEVARLAEDQSALRRVATLVAQGVPPAEVFAAVAEEIGRIMKADLANVLRYEVDSTATLVASWSDNIDSMRVGSSWTLDGDNISTRVFRTRRPSRVDDYDHADGSGAEAARQLGLRSAIGAPIMVDGRLWGSAVAGSTQRDRLPVGAEARIGSFAELIATAISNTHARTELRRLADEQRSLRGVATLIARGVPPDEIFAAVTKEAGRALGADSAALIRYEADDTVRVVAGWAEMGERIQVGTRWPLEGLPLATSILRTGRPASIDDVSHVAGPVARFVHELGIRSAAGSPIVVEGRLWGVLVVHSTQAERLPRETESRLTSFTELVATAVSNAESRAELTASRARIVAAADDTRRRLERDLHDGAQQRLVSLGLELRQAEAMTPAENPDLRAHLSRIGQGLTGVFDVLREISHGIHPAILSEGGLGPAIRTLARRSVVPVELDVRVERRLPDHVEVAAYYVVSEALANVAKHANASGATVRLEATEGMLRLSISDDGVGGADSDRGSGLIGLTDRVGALAGTISVVSPVGEGTSLRVELPFDDG